MTTIIKKIKISTHLEEETKIIIFRIKTRLFKPLLTSLMQIKIPKEILTHKRRI